jgi:hypothetical protein
VPPPKKIGTVHLVQLGMINEYRFVWK